MRSSARNTAGILRSPRRPGLVLVAVAAVLLPVSAATGARWLAAPIIVCGVLGLGLLVVAIVNRRD